MNRSNSYNLELLENKYPKNKNTVLFLNNIEISETVIPLIDSFKERIEWRRNELKYRAK